MEFSYFVYRRVHAYFLPFPCLSGLILHKLHSASAPRVSLETGEKLILFVPVFFLFHNAFGTEFTKFFEQS